MVALDLTTGAVKWKTALPHPAYGAATVANDIVLTTTFDGVVWALDRTTADRLERSAASGDERHDCCCRQLARDGGELSAGQDTESPDRGPRAGRHKPASRLRPEASSPEAVEARTIRVETAARAAATAEGEASDGTARCGEGRLHRQVRQLSYARRRRVFRVSRPQSRRTAADGRTGRDKGAKRRRRHAVVRGQADRRADRERRRVRRPGFRPRCRGAGRQRPVASYVGICAANSSSSSASDCVDWPSPRWRTASASSDSRSPQTTTYGDLLELRVPDPLAEGLVALVDVSPVAGLLQRGRRARRRLRDGRLADGQHPHLNGREPEREVARRSAR